jgi:hypothetical protein
MHFQATPLVPFQKAIETNQEKGEEDEDHNTDLRNLEKIMSKIIDNRQVHLIAKSDSVSLWERKGG